MCDGDVKGDCYGERFENEKDDEVFVIFFFDCVFYLWIVVIETCYVFVAYRVVFRVERFDEFVCYVELVLVFGLKFGVI